MFRTALTYLEEWNNRGNRKPLVIRGARQVGKSYLVSMFAHQAFETFIEINFEKEPDAIDLFKGSTKDTVALLELKYNKVIKPETTLLFLDEIQAAPQVFAKLRYFYEDMPKLPVIAAGSLLEFILEAPEFSMPVGRIEYLHLGPVSFEEFLAAAGKEMLLEFIKKFSFGDDFPAPVHNELITLFKSFMTIGGMPEAVDTFARTGSFKETDIVKASILETYKDDFNKYAGKVSDFRMLNLFNKLPLIVGEKFKYVNIDRNDTAANISRSLHLLEMARIVYKICHSACNGIPLGAQVNEKFFKIIFLDVGLMASACGLDMVDIQKADNIMAVNSGSLCEQFVGQHLLYSGPSYKSPELHYWTREAKSSSAEVDYVIASGTRIVPVEVKAGSTGHLKSLHQFIKEKQINLAVRINIDKPTLMKDRHHTSTGDEIQYQLLSIPFYLTGQVRRLIKEVA